MFSVSLLLCMQYCLNTKVSNRDCFRVYILAQFVTISCKNVSTEIWKVRRKKGTKMVKKSVFPSNQNYYLRKVISNFFPSNCSSNECLREENILLFSQKKEIDDFFIQFSSNH